MGTRSGDRLADTPGSVTTVGLSDPSLVLLVGAAGAGKSTFAARHFAPPEILSSDAFRALLSGDEADQAASGAAFALLHRAVGGRLASGLMSVVDATNVDRRARFALRDRARAADVPTAAFVLALPDAVVLARNRARARQVDESVVRRQLERVRRALEPNGLASEGFATIWIGRTPDEVTAVSVERTAGRPR